MLHTEPQKTNTNHKNTINPVMAGLAGVVAGAAGVTMLALTDKDIRKKVAKRTKEATSSLQKWSSDKLHEVQNESDKVIPAVKDELQTHEEEMKEVKEKISK
jgi:ATP-dependent protease HslVU (ClpYQ) peptidase subunit